MGEGCVFCDQSWMRAAEIFIETPHCIFASTRDPGIRAGAGLAEGVLPGSGAIVPIAHRTSVFELTPAEWAQNVQMLPRHISIRRLSTAPLLTRRPSCSYSLVTQVRRPRIAWPVCIENSRSTYMSL